jgi:hypothetical protein
MARRLWVVHALLATSHRYFSLKINQLAVSNTFLSE